MYFILKKFWKLTDLPDLNENAIDDNIVDENAVNDIVVNDNAVDDINSYYVTGNITLHNIIVTI